MLPNEAAPPDPRPDPYFDLSSLKPFATTSSDAPVSATTAIQSVAWPVTARARNSDLQADGDGHVGLDDRHRAVSQTKGERHAGEFVGHQRHVGRLERGMAARHPHGNTEVGGCERRRVVDAVSDHRDGTVALPQVLDGAHLVLGQQVGADLVDADRVRHEPRRRFVVTREHHHVPDADACATRQSSRARASRTSSAMASIPTASPSSATITGVCPRPASASRWSCSPACRVAAPRTGGDCRAGRCAR